MQRAHDLAQYQVRPGAAGLLAVTGASPFSAAEAVAAFTQRAIVGGSDFVRPGDGVVHFNARHAPEIDEQRKAQLRTFQDRIKHITIGFWGKKILLAKRAARDRSVVTRCDYGRLAQRRGTGTRERFAPVTAEAAADHAASNRFRSVLGGANLGRA
jgi:hypothetical protein